MPERPQEASNERGFARAEIAVEINDQSRLQLTCDRGAQCERRVFIGQECGQHAGIIEE
jgi:hypothetical protein